MAAVHGIPPVLNYRHLYDRRDLREASGPGRPLEDPGTIMGMIANNPDFSITANLIYQSGMDDRFRDPGSLSTIFIAPDRYWKRNTNDELLRDIDLQTAASLIQFSTLPYPLTLAGMNLRRAYVQNLHPMENLLINGNLWQPNIGTRFLTTSTGPNYNYNAHIIKGDIAAKNGVIHILNAPLVPRAG